MNEQLQSALVKIIDKTMSGIDASVGFLSAEIPEVITQLLTWYAIEGVITSLLGLLMVIACAYFWRVVYKTKPNDDADR